MDTAVQNNNCSQLSIDTRHRIQLSSCQDLECQDLVLVLPSPASSAPSHPTPHHTSTSHHTTPTTHTTPYHTPPHTHVVMCVTLVTPHCHDSTTERERWGWLRGCDAPPVRSPAPAWQEWQPCRRTPCQPAPPRIAVRTRESLIFGDKRAKKRALCCNIYIYIYIIIL